MTVSTISVKGQVTLPAAFRRKLGIKVHDRVFVELADKGILIKPALDFFQLEGFLGKGLPLKEERQRMMKGVSARVLKGTR